MACRWSSCAATTASAIFYRWKKRFGDLGTAEVRELRQLREENRASVRYIGCRPPQTALRRRLHAIAEVLVAEAEVAN